MTRRSTSRSMSVRCVPALLRNYRIAQDIPPFTGDTIATNDFIDQFLRANGGGSNQYRGAIRHFHAWAGGDAAIVAADARSLESFAKHRCSKWLPASAGKRDPRLRYANICARLLLYLQDQGLSLPSGWEDGLELCEAYRANLTGTGYSDGLAACLVRDLGHAIVWCRLNRIAKTELNNENSRAFLAHRCLCGIGARHTLAGKGINGRRLTAWRRLERIVAGEDLGDIEARFLTASPQPPKTLSPSGEAFIDHLRRDRGLSASTLRSYRFELARWIDKLGEDGSKFTAEMIRDVFRAELTIRSPGLAGRLVTVLRSYLAYRALRGDCSPAIVKALIARRTVAAPPIPPVVDRKVLRSIMSKIDPTSAVAMRDYAICMLLLELGVRGGEVSRMQLEDIDFEDAKIAIRGKGGRAASVPITAGVGEALIAYLENERPRSEAQAVFLRARPPHVGMHPNAVSFIVYVMLRKHGLPGAAHVFRRSLATALLEQSAGIDEVATVLRHTSVDTSRIYVRVSQRMLGSISQPFGGAA